MQAGEHSGARMLEIVAEVTGSADKNSKNVATSSKDHIELDLKLLETLAADKFEDDAALERLISRARGN
jgi:hypothetical protein